MNKTDRLQTTVVVAAAVSLCKGRKKMSTIVEVTSNAVENNSFERARSVSRSRGQTAEEKAFEEMKKMLLSYEKLAERLMTENASLAGRVTALESSLTQTQKMHQEALEASKEEISVLKQKVNLEQSSREQLQGELTKTKSELESKLAKLHQGCLVLDRLFKGHTHGGDVGSLYYCNPHGGYLGIGASIPQKLEG